MVQHVVMWNLRPEIDKSATITEMQRIFSEFAPSVPGLRSLHIHEGFQGWDACLVSQHDDKEALKIYENHPGHMEAKKYVHSVRIERASCDFERPDDI